MCFVLCLAWDAERARYVTHKAAHKKKITCLELLALLDGDLALAEVAQSWLSEFRHLQLIRRQVHCVLFG